jgi:hypothetical protein
MCCGKEIENHKMKLTQPRPQWFKGTKTTNLPIHYYQQKGAEMGIEISENCLQKMFLPRVQSLLKEKGLAQK